MAPGRQETRAWKLAGGTAPSIRRFDGELIVFSPLSGHTHYLDVVSGETLTLVVAGICNTHMIGSRIAAFLGVDHDDHVVALVHRTLEKLEEVKLIERVAD